jgi:AsmA protein
MMKRIFNPGDAMRKRWVIWLGAALLAVLILFLALPFLVDLSAYKDRFLPPVEAALNRRVDVEKIRLSLFPFGARAEGITIFDDPGFSIGPFLTVESAVAHLRFFPLLLHRKVEVAEFELRRPELVLIKNREGVLNFSTLGKGRGAAERISSPPPSSDSPPLLGIGGELVTLENGKVTWIDRSEPGAGSWRLEQLRLKAKDLLLGKTAAFQSSMRLEPAGKEIELKGEIGPLEPGLKPERIHLLANVAENDLDLRGGYIGDRLQMKAVSKALNLDELISLLPASASGTKKSSHPPKPSGSPPSKAARVSLEFDLNKVMAKGIELRQVVGRVGLHRRRFSVERLSASLLGGGLNGKAEIDISSSSYPFTTDLSLKGIRLEELLPRLVAVPAGIFRGVSDLSVSLSAQGEDWLMLSRSLTGTGNLSVQNGGIENFNLLRRSLTMLNAAGLERVPTDTRTTFSSLKAAVVVDHGRIRFPHLNMSAQSFTLLGEGTVGIDGAFEFTGEMKLGPEIARQLHEGNLRALLGSKKQEVVLPIRLAGDPQGVRLAVDERGLKKEAMEKFTQRLEKEKKGFFKRLLEH